jgi:hypothetical protein
MEYERTICLLIAFSLSLAVLAPPVLADGGLWVRPEEVSDWELHQEDQQLCAIYYDNGYQNMILTVGLSQLEGEKAIWIFPVPAEPDETVIDIIKGFPSLTGDDVLEEAEEAVANAFNYMRITQPYYGAVWFPFFYLGTYYAGLAGKAAEHDGLTVHERIEKMGLTTELVTAESADALYDYLSAKDVDLPASSKAVLDEYIGQRYSFVVSWISDVEEFKSSPVTYPVESYQRYGTPYFDVGVSRYVLGVSITFPTEKIFYPLKPTSVYGSTRIPTVIYVLSLATPEFYPEIEKDAQVNYFYSRYYNVPDYLDPFFNGQSSISDLYFTKIRLNPPSKYLTDDLWIMNSAPAYVAAAQFLHGSSGYWGFVMLIFISCLSSMLVGWKMFRYHEPQLRNFALLGLANCTSLIGFLLISHKLRINERFSKFKCPEAKVNYQRVIEISIVLAAIPVIYLFFALLSRSFSFSYVVQFMMVIAMVTAPLFLGFFPFVWLFYRDRKLLKFVLFFSATFIALSYVFEFLFQLMI